MSRRLFTTIVAAVSALGLAACTSSTGTHTQSVPPSASSTPTKPSPPTPPSSSSTVSPQGEAATAAYVEFAKASRLAEEAPGDQKRFTAVKAHAVDPALGNEGVTLFNYQRAGIAFKGQPPAPRVKVKLLGPDTKPYPTATLVDCPTVSSTWMAYDTKTHQVVPIKFPGETAKPPHPTTANLIYYAGRWAVQKITTDVRQTCAP